jgi:multiple sugar transport system ATP-binding protein
MSDRRWPVLRAGRPVGLRQVHAARMIAGLEEISGGEIDIGGRVVNDIAPKERDIAMVFQNYALYPHMKVYDNMAFSLKLAKADKAEIDRASAGGGRASWAWANCSTATRASCRAASASVSRWAAPSCASRRSSCSTSRCPISTPSCACRCAPRSRNCTSAATTSVYVTHDQIEAMTMADKIVVMHDGIVEQMGAARTVRPSGQHLRRGLHRLAGDEHAQGRGGCRRRVASRWRAAA